MLFPRPIRSCDTARIQRQRKARHARTQKMPCPGANVAYVPKQDSTARAGVIFVIQGNVLRGHAKKQHFRFCSDVALRLIYRLASIFTCSDEVGIACADMSRACQCQEDFPNFACSQSAAREAFRTAATFQANNNCCEAADTEPETGSLSRSTRFWCVPSQGNLPSTPTWTLQQLAERTVCGERMLVRKCSMHAHSSKWDLTVLASCAALNLMRPGSDVLRWPAASAVSRSRSVEVALV